jgi:N-acetylmuramoyl-L-alanine amidase
MSPPTNRLTYRSGAAVQSPSDQVPGSGPGVAIAVAVIMVLMALITAMVLGGGQPSTNAPTGPSGDARPMDTEAPTAGTSTEPAPGSPASDAPTEPTPAPIPVDARVALTSTGVPVAIVDSTPTGHVVRTPCGTPVELGTLRPLHPVQVVVDPGHGGPVDTGAIGPNGLSEANLNLLVARAFASELEDRGISAALTRTDDYAVPIQVRAAFAEAAEAELMVSVHHNAPASARSSVPGTEVYVQSTSAGATRLGGILYEETMAALDQFDIAWTRRHDAGVVQVLLDDGRDAYGILRLPTVPTALVELGYLANPAEAAFFATEAYVGTAASALANGVEAYLTTDRSGSGHLQPARRFTPRRSYAPDDCANPPLGD